jgi:UDP:flavonoid glycosyltransferase YjiC (YdhE family)
MREVSVMVTHGGHGTVSRALWRGLPLLVMPMGRDQDDIAARVVFHGAGLVLPSTAPATEIAAALTRLVCEPPFRAAARRLGAAITEEIAAARLVDEMEAIVAISS